MRRSLLARLSFLVALAPVSALAGTRAADRVADPAEVAAFRETSERFAGRMEEIAEDTRVFVAFREAEEKAHVEDRYRDPMNELEARQREQRVLSQGRFESFLVTYPNAPSSNHVRFRLAELYFEDATEQWQASSARYFAQLEDPNLSIEEAESLGEAPKRDLGRSIALYDQIIASNRGLPPEQRYEYLDGTYLMLGFVYNDVNALQYDEAKAKATFSELITVSPNSELADRSHLFLGNFAFAANEFDPALAEYRYVYTKGKEGKYFEEALYQLAWAQYKLDRFDESLALFTELLDLSEQKELDTGRESAFAPDARRFMAFSFADLGFDEQDAHTIAQAYFQKIGPRPYEREVYVQLTDVLERYYRPNEAIATYDALQADSRWTLESDNPVHQIAVIDLYTNSRDLVRAGEERLEFIDRYSEGTAWWDANRSNPEALQVARKYIEGSLLDVAVEYRVRAQESGQAADFLLAAAKYQEYLDKFPIADDYYKQQYYLADSLRLGQKWDESLAEYQSLIKSKRHHPYGDAALYALMEIQLARMTLAGHAPDQPPENAQVARTYTAGEGEIQVFDLSQDRKDFVAAADGVLDHDFATSEDEDLPDFQTEVNRLRPSVLYLTGQIYYYHNDYEEARKRFWKLLENHHGTLEANYAAGLIMDSYTREGNLAELRRVGKMIAANPPGPPDTSDPHRYDGTIEGATFKLANELGQTGDPTEAAEAFVAFREEFPKSKFGADALYNAAYYYQQSGKVGRSNELYEQFVRENPSDKRSLGLFFRIAANYESAFELQSAVDYYDKILKHPNATPADKADAQYNKSFLQIGMGRYREAAEGYEAYERNYPDQPDKEEVLFRAGEQWEEVSTDDAIDFYNRYKRKYPDASADRVIEADYRLYQLYEKKRDVEPWRMKRQKDLIIEDFERFAKANVPIGPTGHQYAAAAEYPTLEKAYEDYAKDKLTGNEDRDADLLEKKKAELLEVEGKAKAFVAKYQNFEYNSGALLIQARAALVLSDLGLSIKCPKGMDEETCWDYEDILQNQVFPQFYAVEEVGKNRLKELVQAAKDSKRHSRYVDEAMAELNRRDPGNFPAVKKELTGGTEASMPVDLEPLRIETPAEPAPGQTPPPPAPGDQP